MSNHTVIQAYPYIVGVASPVAATGNEATVDQTKYYTVDAVDKATGKVNLGNTYYTAKTSVNYDGNRIVVTIPAAIDFHINNSSGSSGSGGLSMNKSETWGDTGIVGVYDPKTGSGTMFNKATGETKPYNSSSAISTGSGTPKN